MTEPGYLEELGRRHRETIRIEFGKSGAVPATLVEEACKDMDENLREASRGDVLYDEIWCVFDRDEHRDIVQSLNRARDRNVRVAFSNPCFELWLVLHYQDQTAYIERHDVQRLARSLGLIEGKAIKTGATHEFLKVYEHAKRRAQALDRMHSRDSRPPRSNPSTGVWRLVDSIRRGPAGAV